MHSHEKTTHAVTISEATELSWIESDFKPFFFSQKSKGTEENDENMG
jgi:hypothetical protein